MSCLTMFPVYGQKLADDLPKATFVALQADETTNVACVWQCVLCLGTFLAVQLPSVFLSFS